MPSVMDRLRNASENSRVSRPVEEDEPEPDEAGDR